MKIWGRRHIREHYLEKRSPAQLLEDLRHAFDEIGALKIKIWILTGAVLAEAGAVKWLASALLSCIHPK